MISFHNDHLAPPELCRLLAQFIDEEHHCPVVFLSAPSPKNDYAQGRFWGDHISIHLNSIYRLTERDEIGSPSASLWYALLFVCFHEFGHVAERDADDGLPTGAYSSDDRAFDYIEALANRWGQRKLHELRDYDTRLCQPTLMRGYLGARLMKEFRHAASKPWGGLRFTKERRWLKTGAQLSSGEMLSLLGLGKTDLPKAYRALRHVSRDVGTEYVDRAGRRHRLYTWGDVPIIGRRIETNRTLCNVFTQEPRCRVSRTSGTDLWGRAYDFWDDEEVELTSNHVEVSVDASGAVSVFASDPIDKPKRLIGRTDRPGRGTHGDHTSR